jgi:sterol desaturase/sphingolipid hydroxylase (fatty acid hydroxylase superfamily)
MDALLAHEPSIRLGVFITLLVGLALAEAVFPRRPRTFSRWVRWPSNLAIVALNTVALRLAFPIAAVGAALWAAERGFGLLNWLGWGAWAAVPVAFVLLDLAIYFQHRIFHAIPLLWRLHRMHHTDVDLDVTSGARFHPFEIFASMAIKLAAVVALGAPPAAVVLFEVALNATAMFNHANLALPRSVDAVLRWLVVTPDMHRVHHSVEVSETNSNFGFNLPWWDRLFRTYRDQPAAGHIEMTVGLEDFRAARAARLDQLIVQPFVPAPLLRAG